MRVGRSLLTGAAVAAALSLGSPVAHADNPPAPKAATVDDQKVWQEQDPAAPAAPVAPAAPAAPAAADPKPDSEKKVVKEEVKKEEVKKEEVKKEEAAKETVKKDEVKKDEVKKDDKATTEEADAPWQDQKKPHGGVHAGGGAMAVSGGGLASGAALLAGGVGVGAYALRRRNSAEGAA